MSKMGGLIFPSLKERGLVAGRAPGRKNKMPELQITANLNRELSRRRSQIEMGTKSEKRRSYVACLSAIKGGWLTLSQISVQLF